MLGFVIHQVYLININKNFIYSLSQEITENYIYTKYAEIFLFSKFGFDFIF